MKSEKLQLEKLPKWAQEHIEKLARERDCAVKALNKYCDSQTLSSFYSDEMESTGESQGPSIKRRYFQGRKISVNYAGVLLDISLHDGNEINHTLTRLDAMIRASSGKRLTHERLTHGEN